jgi:type II secretory pathway component PulJ
MDPAWELASTSVIALSIGGISALLGLWIGRDKDRPIGFALAMTALVASAVLVGIVQSILDAEKSLQKEADLARMIDTVAEIAVASGDTELAALIEAQVGTRVEVEPLEDAEADAEQAADAPTDGEAAAPSDGEAAAPTDPTAATPE